MDKQSKGILAAALDPMCVPQLQPDCFRDKGVTYAQELRLFIEFVLSNDPMDNTSIY